MDLVSEINVYIYILYDSDLLINLDHKNEMCYYYYYYQNMPIKSLKLQHIALLFKYCITNYL